MTTAVDVVVIYIWVPVNVRLRTRGGLFGKQCHEVLLALGPEIFPSVKVNCVRPVVTEIKLVVCALI